MNRLSTVFQLHNGHVTLKLYTVYCTALIFFIIHQRLIEPVNTISIYEDKPVANEKLKSIETKSDSLLYVCGREIIIPPLSPSQDYNRNHDITKKILVVIGHDKMNHVQTNNRLNAILHAMDYANDINAQLALNRNGWPTKTLKFLFNHNSDNGNTNDVRSWEQSIERKLNVIFVDYNNGEDSLEHEILDNVKYDYDNVYYNNSDDMYYYHTSTSVETIKRRRQPVLQYLWTHPTTTNATVTTQSSINSTHSNKDMCSVMKNITSTINKPIIPKSFTVIHSRWMKNNGCLKRLGALAHRIYTMTGISIDRKAPCLLQPNYIQSILKKSNMIGKPIYIITDGLNMNVYNVLKSDPIIGRYVHLAPKEHSWVGSDMMLGVLSDCFIGTPISTLSGNVARARLALGKDASTNFLFPLQMKKRVEEKDDLSWEFACQSNGVDCLYDVQVLSHYVG